MNVFVGIILLAHPFSATCKPCEAGFYCPDGRKRACPQGMYQPNQKQSKCEACPAGFSCTATKKTQCTGQTFSLEGDATCLPCSTCPSQSEPPLICLLGEYFDANSKKCQKCPAGSACKDGIQVICLLLLSEQLNQFFCFNPTQIATCPTGYVSPPGSETCFICPERYSCSSKATGVEYQLCSPGTFSPTGNVNCLSCPKNHMCPNKG